MEQIAIAYTLIPIGLLKCGSVITIRYDT